jgi:ADP-ribosyl-[dinitrogen reductase] hydrolase
VADELDVPDIGRVERGSRRDRELGALLGLAVGDALGTTYEFERIDQPPYPALATGPAIDVVGGGPFGLAAGQVTDDTHMSVCLARSLAERGALDVDDVARRYVAWTDHAFDIGNQTRAALDRIANGASPRDAASEVWLASGRRAAGNGSLMRTAPIGVAVAARAGIVDAAIADSMITHADPRCVIACVAFDVAIVGAITTAASVLVTAARGADAGYLALQRLDDAPFGRDDLADASRAIARDIDAAGRDDPDVYSDELHLHRTAGFVRVAFRLALWHAAHTPSWRDAVVDVASRGGDADTNAAIVGALLGARDGVTAIPPAWIARVLDATQPGPLAWADAHHPRHLLALVR